MDKKPKEDTIDKQTLRKMVFIYNALQNGWKIHKKKQYYIFRKKHEYKEEIMDDAYLSRFVKENTTFKNE
jgi:hypothetical protein